jgi:hypothetical protein
MSMSMLVYVEGIEWLLAVGEHVALPLPVTLWKKSK